MLLQAHVSSDAAPSPPPPPLSEEEQLLEGLRLKAEAFSNSAWSEYWSAQGPSLLVSGWQAVYPLIPLDRLQRVCALHYLTQALDMLALEGGSGGEQAVGNGGHMTGGEGHMTGNGGSGGHMTGSEGQSGDHETGSEYYVTGNEAAGNGDHMIGNGHATGNGDHMTDTTEDAVLDGASRDDIVDTSMPVSSTVDEGVAEDEDDSTPLPSDERIAALWNEHYNSYYWYCYHQYCDQVEGAEEGGGAGEEGETPMEEFAVEGEGLEVGNGSGDGVGNGEGVLGEEGGEEREERETVRCLVEEAVQSAVRETVRAALGQGEGGGVEGASRGDEGVALEQGEVEGMECEGGPAPQNTGDVYAQAEMKR